MAEGCLQRFLIADARERRSVGRLGSLLGRILLAQHERVHLQSACQLIERGFNRERTDRRAWRTIGCNLGPVGHDVVADDRHIGDVVGCQSASHRPANGRARERAGLQSVGRRHGSDLAVLGGTDLDRARRSRRRTRGAKHLLAGHHHLDRATAHARQDQCHWFQIDDGLAAEPAADLGRDRAHVAELQPGQLGRHVAHHEVALAAAPDGGAPILRDADNAGVGLDIALMHGLGFETALDDHLGRGEAGLDVTECML